MPAAASAATSCGAAQSGQAPSPAAVAASRSTWRSGVSPGGQPSSTLASSGWSMSMPVRLLGLLRRGLVTLALLITAQAAPGGGNGPEWPGKVPGKWPG